jgi:hypothetical protein
MTNGQINTLFFDKVGSITAAGILMCIARHYEISSDDAYLAVTGPESEHLLEYMVGPDRSLCASLMAAHGLVKAADSGDAPFMQVLT